MIATLLYLGTIQATDTGTQTENDEKVDSPADGSHQEHLFEESNKNENQFQGRPPWKNY